MTTEPAAPTGVNGSLALLWVIGIVGVAGGVVATVAENDFGPWALGAGVLAIVLALAVQAIRHTPKL